jgi:hypothetical protein
MTDGSDRGRFFMYTLILAALAFSALTVIGNNYLTYPSTVGFQATGASVLN